MENVIFEKMEEAQKPEKKAKLGKRFELRGELKHEIQKNIILYPQRVIVVIYGDIGFEGMTVCERILTIDIRVSKSPKEINVGFFVEEYLQQVFAVRKFREILKRYLEELMASEDIDDVIRQGISKFIFTDLSYFNEASFMLQEVQQAMSRLYMTDPETIVKLRGILGVLGVVSKCDAQFTHEDGEHAG